MPPILPPVFRFAPSPNGYLHLGHALSALLNADRAKGAGGRVLLRIEDIDETRCRPEFETAIYEDLAWLGLNFEAPVRRQSQHYDDYRTALVRLDAMGLIYPSFESRAEIARLVALREPWPRDPDGAPLYPGEAKTMAPDERPRRMAAGEPYALRLDMQAALSSLTSPLVGEVGEPTGRREAPPDDRLRESGGGSFKKKITPLPNPPPQGGREQEVAAPPFILNWSESGEGPDGETGLILANPAAWGDVILARKETPTSYHLAVAVDDAAQGITDVVRGCDLFHATSVHRLLQALLGYPQPRYHHHRLILDADGRKLSKSTQATGLRDLRERGASPADIRNAAGLD